MLTVHVLMYYYTTTYWTYVCHLAAGKPDPLGPGNWGRGIVL